MELELVNLRETLREKKEIISLKYKTDIKVMITGLGLYLNSHLLPNPDKLTATCTRGHLKKTMA